MEKGGFSYMEYRLMTGGSKNFLKSAAFHEGNNYLTRKKIAQGLSAELTVGLTKAMRSLLREIASSGKAGSSHGRGR